MSLEENQSSHQNPAADQTRLEWMKEEIDDVNVRGVVKFAVGLLIIGIVAYVALYGVLRMFERERLAAEAPPPAMARGAEERLPPPPRLQMMPGSPSELKTPAYEMNVMVGEEDKTLNSYGWVDKNSGVVRIPINEAMKLVLEKGLPTKPAPAGQPSVEPGKAHTAAGRENR